MAPEENVWDRVTAGISRRFVRRHCCCFWSSFAVILLLAIGGIVITLLDANSRGQASLLSESTDYDFLVGTALTVKQQDMVESAERLRSSPGGDRDQEIPERSATASSSFNIQLLFLHKDDGSPDLLSAAGLVAMCAAENVVLGAADYGAVCLNRTQAQTRSSAQLASLQRAVECEMQSSSVVSLFYTEWALREGAEYNPAAPPPEGAPTASDYMIANSHRRSCIRLNESYVEARAAEIYALAQASEELRAEYGFFLSSDTFEHDPPRTSATRSMLRFGRPLHGYATMEEEEEQQEAAIEAVVTDIEADLFAYCEMKHSFLHSPYRDECQRAQFNMKFFAPYLANLQFSTLVSEDLLVVSASVLFVTFYIAFHSGSLLMALLGILQIVLSLPVALFFYTAFRMQWFSQLHILAFFIVLGIGADDLFVLLDAWRQSARLEVEVSGTLEARMIYTYRRSVSTMINTSLTTAVAFLATGLSPIMPISAFGIFAALCVIANFALSVTFWPAAVVVYEVWLSKPRCEMITAIVTIVIGSIVTIIGILSLTPALEQPTLVAVSVLTVGLVLLGCAVSGCRKHCRGENRVLRLPSRRAPESGARDMPREDSKDGKESMQKTQPMRAPAKLGVIETFFRDKYSPLLNAQPRGEAKRFKGVLLPAFKPISLILVLTMAGIGSYLSYEAILMEPPSEEEAWFPRDHMVTTISSDFDSYLVGADEAYVDGRVYFGLKGLDRSGFNRYLPDKNRGTVEFDEQFDLSTAEAQASLLGFCASLRVAECGVAACTRPPRTLVVAESVRCWLEEFQAASNGSLPTGADFEPLVQDWVGGAGAEHAKAVGFVDGRLAFTSVEFVSTAKWSEPGKVVRPYYDRWDAYLAAFVRAAPRSLSTVFCYTGDYFVWMTTEVELVRGIFIGFAICFPVAFVVLFLATGSLSIAVFAIGSIAFIVGSLLGFTSVALDWSLGVGESIAGTIVIGLAVDYTVHLGHAYTEAASESREDKASYAATVMGVTVVAGGITTLGSSLFMFACQVTFFSKMATLIAGTIGFSLLFSLLFFVPLCAIAGPTGRITPVTERLRSLRRRRFRSKRVGSERASTGARDHAADALHNMADGAKADGAKADGAKLDATA